MRKPTNIENRVRVRAYYMALWTNFTECPVSCWLRAEQLELALAERRSQAARKGAATKAEERHRQRVYDAASRWEPPVRAGSRLH